MKMNLGKMCHGCEKRKVGCHSTCQPYVVAKVIHTYKSEKASREKDIMFNTVRHDAILRAKTKKKMSGKAKGFSYR